MTTLFLLFSIFAPPAHGHGEDKPGPHGGFIRMPGAYHVEVVAEGKEKLRIYLLDLHWKNPSVKDSRVEVSFNAGREFNAECKKEKESYLCGFPKSVDLKSTGTLRVLSRRDGVKGIAAEYPTPLRLEKPHH